MKMTRKHIYAVAVLLIMPLIAGAQALKGSYFLDNSFNRHELNPAFAPRANYFQGLGIGNIGVGAMSNLDVPTLFYPKNGELLTFLNKGVSVKEFDKKLPNHIHLDTEVSTTLLGFGFYTKRLSYWTFDLDIKGMVDMDMPRDLLMFVKKGVGTDGNSYNIGNVNGYMMAGLQASLGYSRIIFNGFRAGIKAKFIAPIAYAAMNLENVRLDTSYDKWTITTEGYAHAALLGLDVSVPENEVMPSVGGFDLNKTLAGGVLAGMGVAFDLGVEYTLNLGTIFDGLSVSAAVTDLGMIKYKGEATKSFKTSGSVDWTGFQDLNSDNLEFESTIDEFMQKAKEELFNLSEVNTVSGFTRSTMPRFYVGAEMPFLKRSMSVGLLYSSRLSHSYARHEMTVSYNLNPCKWFALGLNYSFLNTANTMGFILEFTPKAGPAFYIGGDYIPVAGFKVPSMSQSLGLPLNILPLSMRLNLNFGIALHLGSKHLKKAQEEKKD